MHVVARDLLLDGHSLAYRAWFALQEAQLSTASGQETQAVFGFVSMLAKLLEDQSPTGMAVAFDRRGPTFRDALAATYKAGRPVTPEPLLEQIELIRRLVETLGVPAVDAEGYEADDVIATLATSLSAEGHEVVIVTGDRDAYQLVHDPLVKVLYNRRGVTDYVLYDEAGIEEQDRRAAGAVPVPGLAARRSLRQPSRASRGWGRRPRPSSSTPTATSTRSTRTWTSRRRSSGPPLPSTRRRCGSTCR